MEKNASQEIPSEIGNNYYIAECLTPQKTLKTFVAFPKDSWVSVIVKEVSEKAFEIYKQISIITNTAALESGGSHIARILELIQADGRYFVITESIVIFILFFNKYSRIFFDKNFTRFII